jgi:peptidoglycan-N-acetylglucosamine deacetylase
VEECHKSHSIELVRQFIMNTDASKPAPDNQKPNSHVPEAPILKQDKQNKIAYLTFDDGPSKNVTPLILDILKKYDVKATFFVLGGMVENNKTILSREFNEGHSVGNHTYSHKYDYLYSSPEHLLGEINECDKDIKTVLPGYNEKIFRFPGGSFGRDELYKDDVLKSGYKYFDWNCLTGDSDGINIPTQKLFEEFKSTSLNKNPLIILMHDSSTKETTPQSLPEIIEYLKSQGFIFKTLN